MMMQSNYFALLLLFTALLCAYDSNPLMRFTADERSQVGKFLVLDSQF
jgi:hypothetical protein